MVTQNLVEKPAVKIESSGEGIGRRWRVWIGDVEISSITKDIQIITGHDKADVIELRLQAKIITKETPTKDKTQ